MGYTVWPCRIAALAAGLLALSGPGMSLSAADFDRGQALYENHCTACHDNSVHRRDSQLVQSRGDLQLYVSTWSFHAQLGWSREEITDVTGYLDRTYYNFSEQP